MKNINIPIVIAIDGIDDISIFGMRQENYENKNFSISVKSLLPLINIASGSVTHFQIMFFIPESPVTVKKQILPSWRFDKLPHIQSHGLQISLDITQNLFYMLSIIIQKDHG